MIMSDALRTGRPPTLFGAWSDLGEADLPNRRDTYQGYLAPANQWLDLIAMEPPRSGWIIGHNPGISALVLEATGDYDSMTTADIVIDLAIDDGPTSNRSGSIVRHRPDAARNTPMSTLLPSDPDDLMAQTPFEGQFLDRPAHRRPARVILLIGGLIRFSDLTAYLIVSIALSFIGRPLMRLCDRIEIVIDPSDRPLAPSRP